jgi:hypothetical protein
LQAKVKNARGLPQERRVNNNGQVTLAVVVTDITWLPRAGRSGRNCTHRALAGAQIAVGAKVSINDIAIITFADSISRTDLGTGTTRNASFAINYMSHE